jgi:hypothetical protein
VRARGNTQAVWVIWTAVPPVFRSEIIPHIGPQVHEHHLQASLGENWQREKARNPALSALLLLLPRT